MTRVLVVDDDADNRDLIVSILSFHGFETVKATNGRHAVEMATERLPDLIMMDISMPIMNGLEATKIIKTTAELSHIPIVVMSAYDTREDETSAFEAGCIAFMTKPLELFTLKERLDKILLQHGQAQAKAAESAKAPPPAGAAASPPSPAPDATKKPPA